MSDFVQPDRQQPTRLPRPWDSPGKNTGVGCHFLLQCMKVKSKSEVAQSCPTLSNPMDCSSPGSSIHGIFQARVKSPTKDLQTFRLHLEKALTASEEPKDKLIRKIQVFLELTYVFCAITIRILTILTIDFPGGSVVKNLPASTGGTGSVPDLEGFQIVQNH